MKMRKKNEFELFLKCFASLLIVTALMVSFAACSGTQQPLSAPEDGQQTEETTVSIETAYGSLAFPANLQERLYHQEVMEGKTAMEVFYMAAADGGKELYRICYADAQFGTLMGYLTMESGESISVSHSVCEYTEDAFETEDDWKLYYEMMNAINVIMDSIYNDERFSETRKAEAVGEHEVSLRYWIVTLPENVEYEETAENELYSVSFYGQVSGERVKLYTISLGLQTDESTLGWFAVNGTPQPMTIQSYYDAGTYDAWPEEDRAILYRMMDSINSVISVITADENFSEVLPEE